MKSAATAAFQVFLDGLAASQRAGELRTDRSVEMLALAMWSTMHGLTELLLDHLLVENLDHLLVENKAVSALEKAEQLMAHVIQVMAQGLMVQLTTPASSP